MKPIVFGASGFIGSHVVEQLLLNDQEVTAVVRAGSKTDFLQALGANICEIDFENDEQLLSAMKGHELVYNCLANPRMHQSLNEHRKVEVELTGKVLSAACEAGAQRFVQLSTVQVYGFARPPIPVDENHPCEATYVFNQVAQEREARIKEIAKNNDIELVIARPVNTFGKRDGSTSQIFKGHRQGVMVVFGNGENRFSCIDTRDVGRAMVWLGNLPNAAGNTYLISGYETSWSEVKEALDKHLGKPAKFIRVPVFLAKAIAYTLEKLTPYSKDLSLVPFSVSVMSTQTLFDDSKIRATGFTPLYASIEETIDGYYAKD